MQSIILSLCAICLTAQLAAAEQGAPLSIHAQGTSGSYGGSTERKSLLSESVSISYATEGFGAGISGKNWTLARIRPLGDLSGIDTNVSLYARKKVGAGGHVGGAAAVTYLTGNDSNTNGTVVPYGAITCRTPEGGQYFDVGYARMGYRDTTAGQFTSTFGIALFDRYVWSQTRIYYNNLSKKVQGKSQAVSVEERLVWYAVPATLTLSLYGMAGRRVYGYDPDLGLAYTFPDVQRGSGGLTASWDITPLIAIYGDVTYGTYEKTSISNRYNAIYGTAGLAFSF